MKRTLQDLVKESKEIELRIMQAGGELDEATELALYHNELDIIRKTDACVFYLEKLSTNVKNWKDRKEQCVKELKKAENELKRYEDYLKFKLKELDRPVEGDLYKMWVRSTIGELKKTNEAIIPACYKKEIITREWEVDNDRLKDDLALGIPVPGAEIKPNLSLKVKPI